MFNNNTLYFLFLPSNIKKEKKTGSTSLGCSINKEIIQDLLIINTDEQALPRSVTVECQNLKQEKIGQDQPCY